MAQSARTERRDLARAEAARLREVQQQKESRTRKIMLAILGAVLVAVIAIGGFIVSQAGKTLLEGFDGAVPAGSTLNGGIMVGPDGVSDAPTDAPVLSIYADAMCIHCANFEVTNGADLTELRESGDLTVIYHPVSFLDPGEAGASTRAANALVTVATLAPGNFVNLLEVMMASQSANGVQDLSDDQIATFALEAGVPQSVVDAFADDTYVEWVTVASQQAGRDGITATPTLKYEGEKLPTDVIYSQEGVLAEWLEAQKGD